MGKPGATGLTRIWNAFGYSWKGFIAVWKFEAAFRQEVAMAIVFVPASFWLASNHIELILLLMSVVGILIAELVNSAIEAVVDRVGLDQHLLSGRAKDIGSAVVMMSFLQFFLIWGLIGLSSLPSMSMNSFFLLS